MKLVRQCTIMLLAMFLTGCISVSGPTTPPVKLREAANWPLLPQGEAFGQVTGIGVDSHNHVFVFHRAGRTWTEPFPAEPIGAATIFMIDGDSGELLAKWGAGQFIMPHGLSIDDKDNVWVTDVGLQQVFAFSHDGQLLRTIGTSREVGDDHRHFGRPADIAFGNDRLFVADGYLNTRVAVFDRNGNFEQALGGKRGNQPGEVDLPHGIAFDADRIYLADRENSRLQVWSTMGKVIGIWPRDKVGRPYGVDVNRDGNVAIIDGGDQPANTAAMVRLFDRNGLQLAAYDTRRAGDKGNLGHDVAFGRDGALYVGDTWAARVVKLVAD